MTDVRAIARALGGEVIGSNQVLAPGPGHSNKDRSLSIRLSQHTADGFVVHSFAGDDWRECHRHVRSLLGTAPHPERPPVRARWGRQMSCSSDSADEETRVARALEIWDQAQDPRGTLVERYLTRGRANGGRGLEFPHDCAHRVLRFHSKCPWRDEVSGQIVRVPVMIAAMRCIRTNAIKAVHRRRLDIDGEKIGKPRMLGAAGGTAVKLDPDPCVTLGLVVGEGVETCLSARQLGLKPVWALGSVGAIRAFPVLSGIEALTILEETDDGGRSAHAAAVCGDRWIDADREVLLARPRVGGDLNDALMEAGCGYASAA